MNQSFFYLKNNGNLKKIEDIFKDNMISRNQFISCYKNKKIYVNDKIVGRNYKVGKEDTIKLIIEIEENNYKPVKNNIEILYENEDLLLVNKPRGISMTSNEDISLANYISYIFKIKNISSKIRYLNRLDRDTSGIVIVFKNKYIQGVFENEKIKNNTLKEYTGIVKGKLEGRGIIEKSIIREGIKSEINNYGKYSKTEYISLKVEEGNTLVRFILHTGRTHQIRVHMESIGYPLLGDNLYGTKDNKYDTYFLHCSKYKIYVKEGNDFEDIFCKVPKYFPIYQ
ncbi:RluA family pseudouridine synthase [Miniphocaeibacter massiliensis]|uniref:RluA family pseudouridine synthase n=1 Tax=Miniphocaeibacter massiliensis TaxID=2041841 RepID=UPI0013EAB809|nr:RluA family pseudouridine synthase [Miniphocaeibacter massiliensis]